MTTTKSVIFKFRDGPKEIKLGDSVVSRYANRKGHIEHLKVIAIGRKYITVGRDSHSRGMQFDIESGTLNSEYSHHYTLYSSEDAYNECKNNEKHRSAFAATTRFIDNYTSTVTAKQILEAVKALGLEEKFNNVLNGKG